jgi:hypothetical protein
VNGPLQGAERQLRRRGQRRCQERPQLSDPRIKLCLHLFGGSGSSVVRQPFLAFALGRIRPGGTPLRLFLIPGQLPDHLLLGAVPGLRCPLTAFPFALQFRPKRRLPGHYRLRLHHSKRVTRRQDPIPLDPDTPASAGSAHGFSA